MYIRFVFLVVFLFFLAWFFIREYFPLLPMPRHKPRSLILTLLPLFMELGLPLLGSLTFCSVFFLQCGQYLFVFFGSFILLDLDFGF